MNAMQCFQRESIRIGPLARAALRGACLAAISLSAAVHADDGRPPNIVFLLTDDQRPDTIGALGNRHIRTPHLDRLVRSGTAFTRAVCANPICTPSRAEILSGCTSFRNGVLDFGRPINPQLPLWPQTLRAAGFHTWFVGKWHNNGRPTDHGYEETDGLFMGGGGAWWKDGVDWQGFPITGYRGWVFQDDQGRKFPERGVGLTPDISARFADAAIGFIQRRPQRPFFLHVCFTAPHDPLLMPPGYETAYPPESLPVPRNFRPEHPWDHGNLRGRDELLMHFPRTPQAVREQWAMYYRVITHLDEQIGRIVQALRDTQQYDRTLIIFSSDHGLALGSHGLRGKQNMYEHTMGVPLVMCGPGIPPGKICEAQCYLRDLYPTTCDLAGVRVPPLVAGRSLAGVLRGQTDEVYSHVFGYFRNFQRMIRSQHWKLIEYPAAQQTQLFHLAEDPDELTNLADDPRHAAVREQLRRELRAWQRQVGDPLGSD
jgi:arylsulfatase A-like enzyme